LPRLYVGNLAHETTEAQIRAAFAPYGEPSSVKIVSDRRGRTKGFAYVQIADNAAAEAAIEGLKGTQLNGRTMDIVQDNSSGRQRSRRR
jgi:RNA recognition motif-containing protein